MKRISTATRVVNKFGAGKDGFTDGDVIGGVPATDLEAVLFDNLQEELANIVEGAGLVLDGAVLTQVRQAIKRLAGGNVTTVNFAASPFALTADHAGTVLVDATAGNVVINLPAANVLAGLPYAFRRTDASVNTVTINRAGADTIDEGGTSFALTSKAIQQVRSNGATTWSTVTPVAATQAETNAGTDDAKFVTAKKLRFGFAVSLVANGYIVFPSWLGGWVVQWMQGATSSAGVANTLPLAFPTSNFAAFASLINAPSTYLTGCVNTSVSLVTCFSSTASQSAVFIFAVGK